MHLVGLTGGIGSGKSTVAGLLADAGIPIVDADRIARDIVEPGEPLLECLADAFGHEILHDDGSLNRGALAQRAFADEESTHKLNSLMHPEIRRRAQLRFAELREAGETCAVYDMPLLIELGLQESMDLTVVVSTPEAVRVERLVEKRGMDPDDVRARIAAQMTDAEREEAADVILHNDGNLEHLRKQTADLLEKIRSL